MIFKLHTNMYFNKNVFPIDKLDCTYKKFRIFERLTITHFLIVTKKKKIIYEI